ncbi:hypothetical protein ASPZODRAFT_153121 [Penicilliopsis zonata CBS 506.65]|uniref:Uncharacterized protein n=1 Tax=Penicilliopsis zonata CBS 506.65 TaxID=1073090 RepID=A0A1L9SEC6_9EURO|nr:hypothetical protein ASPZODRAFT_153121 [Penicilliopsis zonata CBS 506.65]OJJ45468.1 hypothetical protein ASPZODRAFT_153121 [Penicilliopsis zonata CBS 506.65]
MLLVVAVYASLSSGVFFVVACVRPYYGQSIGDNGGLSPSSASLISAFLAKTVELAYVTTGVAFLGQLLSYRAIIRGSSRAPQGVSLSDLNLRSWITQPGSLLLHWGPLKYSGGTILGAMTLVMTMVAMLYTTAAEALVSPKLSSGPVKSVLVQGEYYAEFAYADWLSEHCKTPITDQMSEATRDESCLSLELAGQSYHDIEQYLQDWAGLVNSTTNTTAMTTTTSKALKSRLPPTSSLYDNTTVTGSWIEVTNMTALSSQYGRMVDNVTAAFPHGGLFAAARNPHNKITQPENLSGDGKYTLNASVTSPAVNVLCVGMTAEELEPIIYEEFPYHAAINTTTWYTEDEAMMNVYTNRTAVDDLFGFGGAAPDFGDQAVMGTPVFPIYPAAWNTIINTKTNNSKAMYLLGAGPPGHSPPYTLCALKAKLSGVCSAEYTVSASAGELSVHCEDGANKLQYNNSVPSASETIYDDNWKMLAWQWADAVNLGSGLDDEDASIERLLMATVPSFDNTTNTSSLDPFLPSASEFLAVLAGSTLLLGSEYSPFVSYWAWNFTNNFSTPVSESFNATLQSVMYASGRNTTHWQRVFFVVLALAFATSFVCTAFFSLLAVRGLFLTDVTELSNLFTLAMNAPPEEQPAYSLGGRWVVDEENHFVAVEDH